MDTNTDRVTAVRELFSTDQPITRESTLAAAQAINALWDYLGHVAMVKRSVLPDPIGIADIFDALTAADEKSADMLQNLAAYIRDIGDESTYTDRYGCLDPDGTADQIQSIAHNSVMFIYDVVDHHRSAAGRLHTAADMLSNIYLTEPGEEL